MKPENSMTRGLALVLLALLAGAGTASVVTMPAVPDPLRVPASEELVLQARGVGVQVYACMPANDDNGAAWSLKAPEADLFDESGEKIGTHAAGPTWQHIDGSNVAAAVTARVDAPEGNAIPWLLLGATTNAGNGLFANVVAIQRLSTHGGTMPAETCDVARIGAESRVPYTATYYFYALAAPSAAQSQAQRP